MAVPSMRQDVNPATTPSTTRRLAALGLLGALLQVLGGVVETVDRVLPGEPGYQARTSAIGLAYLLFLATLVGIARSGATGNGRLPRLGLVTAGTGWVLYAVAQFVLQVDFDLAEQVIFPIATILIGVGMIVAGIGVFRSRRWSGWRRVVALICGVYPFVVLFPTFAATGEPSFLVLAGWGACWFAMALTLWKE